MLVAGLGQVSGQAAPAALLERVVSLVQAGGGLGNAPAANIVLPTVQIGGQVAGGIVGATAAASTAAWAVPVIGAAVAGVTLWLSSMFRRGAQKRATTEVVETIEPKLQENLQAYLSGPRTRTSQAVALANFDAAWSWVVQQCSNPDFGNAGKACISDRSAGGRWPWNEYYRDPIANDPQVRPDPVNSGVAAALGLPNTDQTALLLAAGLVALGVFL
ncbi:MAG: hypothetical protein CUN53_00105 [Phototrophicales bacterium]|nr:MAG: hypothetical protein CUN53_00105 [Phototrophicales bacterium]